jgi:uncharacterized LabA/DUF88 family protein
MARRRVAVFIDYQNSYGAAREAFHVAGDPVRYGQFSPRRLANLLAAKGNVPFELKYIGIYTGLPDGSKDPRSYSARRKQMAAWQREDVTIVTRSLRYPSDWPTEKAEEKGIDVKLAIDAVMMAFQDKYDVGIIASCDTDLAPAVEAILELKAVRGSPEVEVIAWKDRQNKIGVAGRTLTYRWVGSNDYNAFRDLTDYNL